MLAVIDTNQSGWPNGRMTSALSATISVALKGLSKDLREHLQDKNWLVREAAETEAAEVIEKAVLGGFDVSLKPMNMPGRYPAVSDGDRDGQN